MGIQPKIISAAIIFWQWMENRKKERESHKQLLVQFENAQTDVLMLRTAMENLNTRGEELDRLILQKEWDVQNLRSELSKFQIPAKVVEQKLTESETFKNLQKKADMGKLL